MQIWGDELHTAHRAAVMGCRGPAPPAGNILSEPVLPMAVEGWRLPGPSGQLTQKGLESQTSRGSTYMWSSQEPPPASTVRPAGGHGSLTRGMTSRACFRFWGQDVCLRRVPPPTGSLSPGSQQVLSSLYPPRAREADGRSFKQLLYHFQHR